MSGVAARVAAQAKVNLRLCVLAREASGYHAIETVFARVNLADDVLVRVDGRGRSADTHAADTGAPERNLAYRAAAAYADIAGWPTHFAIEIEKRIPVGGGLGGGSADAGATLRALRALHAHRDGEGAALPESTLLGVAASLGADIPFLTSDAPMALAWARGDRLLRLPPLPARDVLILVPAFGVATADAYAWLAASREAARPAPGHAITGEQLRSWSGIAELAVNDFEPVVAGRHRELAAMLGALRAGGASIALMAGSGSVVFGVFDETAPLASDILPPTSAVRIIRTRTASRVVPVEVIE